MTPRERAAKLVQHVPTGTNLDTITVAGVVFHECHRLVAEDLVRDIRACIASEIRSAEQAAIAEEREACARLAESCECAALSNAQWNACRSAIAEDIRARGAKP